MPTFPVMREVTPGDAAFLRRVYASTRQQELALLPLDDAARQAFLEMQFAAQDRQFRQQESARFLVISHGGQDVGRLTLAREAGTPGTPGTIRIMDIALLPLWRGQGLGTAVLRGVTEEAEQHGLNLQLYVEEHNPARRLYERLGFRVAEVHPVYTRMVRSPTAWPASARSAEDPID